MASTYSANLRLELIGTGEQQGTWGSTTNTNLGSLLEQAIGGYESITVSDVGDTTLTTANGSVDQARNMTLNLVGTIGAARNVICPAAEKIYIVKNATTGGFAVTFKVTGQTGVSIPNGSTAIFYVDGTDARLVSQSPVPLTLGGTGATTAAAAATNLGLGTGDSPQFAGVNVGNASDTTITRSAGGVLAVEGGVIPKENRANTFTEAQSISLSSGSNRLSISSPSGSSKFVRFQTAGSSRWEIGSNNAPETGSNNGSDFTINRYDDTGTYIDSPFSIERDIGLTTLKNLNAVAVGIGLTPTVALDMAGEFLIRGAAAAGSVLRVTPDATTGANGVILDTSWITGSAGPLIFKMSGTERMRIDAAGAVTIGGTLSAATAAVDTNTTQVATTAYVIGQGYLKSTTAASTYLTSATAASTYLTSATAASTYLTSATASSTYAPLASPALTGNPTAPTPTAGDNDTSIATTAFVTTAVAANVGITLLGTMTLSGGSTSLPGLTLTNYKFVRFVMRAMSVNIGAGANFSIGTAVVGATTSSGGAIYGIADLDLATGMIVSNWANTLGVGELPRVNDSGYSTATTTIVASVSGGGFDSGTIAVYGMK